MLAGTQQLRSRSSVPVQTHCTEERIRSEGRKGANGDWNGIEDGDENDDGDGGRGEDRDGQGRGKGGRELGNPPNHDRGRVENQALPFHTPHHLCRQEVVLAGIQRL